MLEKRVGADSVLLTAGEMNRGCQSALGEGAAGGCDHQVAPADVAVARWWTRTMGEVLEASRCLYALDGGPRSRCRASLSRNERSEELLVLINKVMTTYHPTVIHHAAILDDGPQKLCTTAFSLRSNHLPQGRLPERPSCSLGTPHSEDTEDRPAVVQQVTMLIVTCEGDRCRELQLFERAVTALAYLRRRASVTQLAADCISVDAAHAYVPTSSTWPTRHRLPKPSTLYALYALHVPVGLFPSETWSQRAFCPDGGASLQFR